MNIGYLVLLGVIVRQLPQLYKERTIEVVDSH